MESIDMYSAYLEELGAKHLYKNDTGFAIYSFIDNSCYIEEIYTLPQYRKQKEATLLADEIMKIAKEKGCKNLLGSVIPSINNSTRSLEMMLSYGFKLISASNNYIVFSKEVK